MIMYVCGILDKKVNAFRAPAFFRSKGEATRAFMDTVSEVAEVKKHPEDYSFWYLGQWDDASGMMIPPENGAEPLMTALDCMTVEGKVN